MQALEKLGEAGDMFFWIVALDEQCMAERPLCVHGRMRLGYCPLPFVLGSTLPAVTGGGRGAHPPTLASEHREGCSIQRSSASGTNLRWRRHSQQIETSSCRVVDVSQASLETLAQRETPMPMGWRMLVDRRDDQSLPRVALQRNPDRPALWWQHHGESCLPFAQS